MFWLHRICVRCCPPKFGSRSLEEVGGCHGFVVFVVDNCLSLAVYGFHGV